MARPNLRRETLAEQVAQHLLDAITEDRMQPGDPVGSELKLAHEFGVSRHIVREALRSLEARGIIEVTNGKGATVKPFGGEPMRDFFRTAVRFKGDTLLELLEVRRGLEMQSAFLAAQRRTDEDLGEMDRVLAVLRVCLYDPDAYCRLDADLHLLIASASRNSMLFHLVESVRGPLQDSIRSGYAHSTSEEKETLPDIHEALVDALRRGEAGRAATLMAHHLDGTILSHTRTRMQDEDAARGL